MDEHKIKGNDCFLQKYFHPMLETTCNQDLEAVLTWTVPLQQIPAVKSPAFGVAHLQALLQQPLGDVALTDTYKNMCK